MLAGSKKGSKPLGMSSNSTVQTSKVGSKAARNNNSSGLTTSLSATTSKSQSQEDLSKPKEKQQRSKFSTGSGVGVAASGNRRMASAKDPAKSTEKAKDKIKSSSKSSSSSVSSGSRGSSAHSRRAKEPAAKQKLDLDKAALEGKIKDLMAMAKTKDSEIRSLKAKLDQMMHLLNKQQEESGALKSPKRQQLSPSSSTPLFSSLVKLSDDRIDKTDDLSPNDVSPELSKLQDENAKLREQMDVMMMTMKQKDSEKCHQQQDVDVVSNDGLSSSLDDLASAASGDALHSNSVSRSTSTENLLDDVGRSRRSGSRDITSEDCLSESSSVTVANLTERIHRMEESHISTNEELEATVQELTDLQKSVPELTIDNDRLQKEKEYLLEKLEETEKRLAEQTSKAEHLEVLVSDHLSDDATHSDLKQQYVRLLNEREQLICIRESMSKELRASEEERKQAEGREDAFKERLRHLERELNQASTEKSMLEKRLKDTKASAEGEHSEIVQKLEEELRKERQRMMAVTGTLQDNAGGRAGMSMLELVDALRSEKQELEERFLLIEEDFAHCQDENERLDARVAELEEELEANNAKSKKDLSELSELIDRLQEDLRIKQVSLDEANETLFVMEDSVEQHIAVKKHDNHIIQQLNNQISSLKEERFRLEKEIQQLKKEQRTQTEEWKQFQADLQMAVMIANDMKAETQAEVTRLRSENQVLDETVTKLRVENDQLRRRRASTVSATSSAILEAAGLRQNVARTSVESSLTSLRDAYKRRSGENSPGVQSLIKSFDSQSATAEPSSPLSPTRTHPPLTASGSVPNLPAPSFSPIKNQPNQMGPISGRTSSSPITATVSPIQRHHSLSAPTPSVSQVGAQAPSSFANKLQPGSNGDSTGSSKPGTPDGSLSGVSGADLTQISSLLRHSSQDGRMTTVDGRKPQLTEMMDRLPPARTYPTSLVTSTPVASGSAKHRALSSATPTGDPLATLARRYGGSKRNALLKWCQEKTMDYDGVDITNFSSSWSDGLAFCALLHAYLPAHIPYESLRLTYVSASDDKTKSQLQAKNFRLAFAAAESVGIEPTLSADELTNKERPDWQRVMSYVTQIYKYFET